MSHTKFSICAPIEQQMAEFSALVASDPEKARAKFETSENLVNLVKQGKFLAFRNTVDALDENGILQYFVPKMFKEALLAGNLIIAVYMLEHGYSASSNLVPSALHECLGEVSDDYRGVDIIQLLHTRKCDINRQIAPQWLTPLHIAISRQLVQCVQTLIDLGADVNSVAQGDVLPLQVAHGLTDSMAKDAILDALHRKGAKTTWRQNKPMTYSSAVETKHVVCSGGSGVVTNHSNCVGGTGLVKFTGSGPLPVPPAVVAEPKETYDVDSIGVIKKKTVAAKISTVTTSTCSISSDGGLMFSTS